MCRSYKCSLGDGALSLVLCKSAIIVITLCCSQFRSVPMWEHTVVLAWLEWQTWFSFCLHWDPDTRIGLCQCCVPGPAGQHSLPSLLSWSSFDLIWFETRQISVTWVCLPLPAMQMLNKGEVAADCVALFSSLTQVRGKVVKCSKTLPNWKQLWFRWLL